MSKIINGDELQKICLKLHEVLEKYTLGERKLVLGTMMDTMAVLHKEIDKKALEMTNEMIKFKKAQEKDK